MPEQNKIKFLIYIQANFEIEAEDEDKAQIVCQPVLDKLVENNREIYFKVDTARVADKKTGYFITK